MNKKDKKIATVLFAAVAGLMLLPKLFEKDKPAPPASPQTDNKDNVQDAPDGVNVSL